MPAMLTVSTVAKRPQELRRGKRGWNEFYDVYETDLDDDGPMYYLVFDHPALGTSRGAMVGGNEIVIVDKVYPDEAVTEAEIALKRLQFDRDNTARNLEAINRLVADAEAHLDKCKLEAGIAIEPGPIKPAARDYDAEILKVLHGLPMFSVYTPLMDDYFVLIGAVIAEAATPQATDKALERAATEILNGLNKVSDLLNEGRQ